jgi:hypothetical protein
MAKKRAQRAQLAGHWKLSFLGGSLNGKVKWYPYLPESSFGCKESGEQEYYVVKESDPEKMTAVLELEAG